MVGSLGIHRVTTDGSRPLLLSSSGLMKIYLMSYLKKMSRKVPRQKKIYLMSYLKKMSSG
jgi:hypothetical protein